MLFDLDGTLVITHIDFAAMRAQVGAAAAAAGVAPQIVAGRDTLSIVERAAGVVGADRGEDAARQFLARAEAAMIAAEMRGLEGARPAPFACEVFQALSDGGIRIGIVTRNCRPAADAVLALAGLRCPVVLTRDDVPKRKPDPAHLLEALSRLGAAPQAAVMVGDHPMDVEAGRAAGTRTVGVLGDARPPDYFAAAAPDLVIQDLRGLLPFVFGAL